MKTNVTSLLSFQPIVVVVTNLDQMVVQFDVTTEVSARATPKLALDLAPEHRHRLLVSPEQTVDVLVVEHIDLGVSRAHNGLRVATQAQDQFNITCNDTHDIITSTCTLRELYTW